jgi:uncharacterized protein
MKITRFYTFSLFIEILIPIFLLSNCAPSKVLELSKVEFTSTPIPNNVENLKEPYTRSSIWKFFTNGSSKEIRLKYNFLFHSGDSIGQGIAGEIKDTNGKTIQTGKAENGTENFKKKSIFPSAPDGNSLILIPGLKSPKVSGHPLFLVTHFEHHSWAENSNPKKPPFNAKKDLPMNIGLTLIDQNPISGELNPVDTQTIESSPVHGIRYPCAASLSPWNTHLGGEEAEPNAKWFENSPIAPMNLFLNSFNKTVKEGGANPYDYGFPIEITVNNKGNPSIKKRYAMGRISLELPLVMPDEKTVYLSDDAKDGIRLMFIADRPRDLTSGRLYAAKWLQKSGKNGGTANLKWIKLGHSKEKEIRELIDQKIVFSDIFDSQPTETINATSNTLNSFRPIFVYQGFTDKSNNPVGETKINYIKIKSGMEKAAAFLETRRYAAYLGATSEFTKMEGQALNKKDKKIYTAISSAKKGMLKGKNGDRFQNDISLEGNSKDLSCGIIYESDLTGEVFDQLGNTIDSEWIAINMKALLLGKKNKKTSKDTCDVDAIASPDNLKFSESMRTLFIGEDSGKKHIADYLWAYTVDSENLARILISPKDSEPSGLQATTNYNGYTYIMTNFQRDIFPENFAENQSHEKANKLVSETDLRGIVGYLGPIPSTPSEKRAHQ